MELELGCSRLGFEGPDSGEAGTRGKAKVVTPTHPSTKSATV